VLRSHCARNPLGMGVVAVLRFTTESARMFTGADRGLDSSPQHDPLAACRGRRRRKSRDSAILSIRPRVAKWDRRSPGAARRGFLYGGGSVSTRIGFCSPTRPAPHRPSASSICGARRMAQWTKVAGPKPPGAMAKSLGGEAQPTFQRPPAQRSQRTVGRRTRGPAPSLPRSRRNLDCSRPSRVQSRPTM
jgi:hypothetical protein